MLGETGQVVVIGGGANGMLVAEHLCRHFRITVVTRNPNFLRQETWFDIIVGECQSVSETADAVTVTLSDRRVLSAEMVVLATQWGSLHPGGIERRGSAGQSSKQPSLAPDSSVLVCGIGPAVLRYVLGLLENGHQGPLYCVSEEDILPVAGEGDRILEIEVADIPLGASLAYVLRWIRSLIAWAGERGYDWRSVVDGLKPHVGTMWRHLSPSDRKRFLTHVQPWWIHHATRMSAAARATIDDALACGRLTILRGRIAAVDAAGTRFDVAIRPRRSTRLHRLAVDHILTCDGEAALLDRAHPLICDLIVRGLARPGLLGFGLDVSSDFALIRADGTVSSRLYAIGPLICGTSCATIEREGAEAQLFIERLLAQHTGRRAA